MSGFLPRLINDLFTPQANSSRNGSIPTAGSPSGSSLSVTTYAAQPPLPPVPEFNGRPIYDWGDTIKQLKKEERYDEALFLARGCMDAMVTAARQDERCIMEHYVIQVAQILEKTKDYEHEVSLLGSWLALQLPAPRDDYRINIHKRLAKAQEICAKKAGQDPSPYTAEWRRLLELEKLEKGKGSHLGKVSTGRSVHQGLQEGRQPRHRLPRVESALKMNSREFVAVDFETANSSRASACQVALVKMSDGRVVDRFTSLIKPPPGHDHFEFTDLHGITAKRVAHAPSWFDISDQLARFIGDLPVCAHNASFDSDVWARADAISGTTTAPQTFYCSYLAARQSISGLPNYKLPTVTRACAPRFKLKHHSAHSDAEACALIVAFIQRPHSRPTR